MFVTGKPLQPSLMFVGKAMSQPLGEAKDTHHNDPQNNVTQHQATQYSNKNALCIITNVMTSVTL